jgi:hypothetical protein
MAFLLYRNKVAMLAVGWTVKFTCDGTTGPTSGSDTTDRWTTQANAQTRSADGVHAQSYAVLQNADGVQVLLDFQGASDDIGRIAYSPGGVYTLATPSTNQPTATDEVVVSNGNSLVNSGTAGDRVMTIWCSNDTKQWSHFIARIGVAIHTIGVERVNSLCGSGVFVPQPYVGYRHTTFNRVNNPTGASGPTGAVITTAVGAAGFIGTAARVFTSATSRIVRLGGGFVNLTHLADGFTRTFNNVQDALNSDTPGLQASRGSPLAPIYWCGEKAANLDGFLGSPIDWWSAYTAASDIRPGLGTFMPGYEPGDNPLTDPERTNWLICLGSAVVRPWRNAATVLRIY